MDPGEEPGTRKAGPCPASQPESCLRCSAQPRCSAKPALPTALFPLGASEDDT
jgi:hypothetical protein